MGKLYTVKDATKISPTYTAADADMVKIGHVFGRLGQADMNMPGVSKPFINLNPAENTGTDYQGRPYMMVGMFPVSENFVLASNENITIEASAADFETFADTVQGAAPVNGTPTALEFLSGMKTAIGTVATAAVAVYSLI